jgi:hypothetical protein
MILDLNPLPYKLAIDIIKWCFDNNVNREKAILLTEMMGIVPDDWPDDLEWTLEIPEAYATWISLRFA